MKRPELFFEYGECVEVFWINPWDGDKERIFMMMWPGHPIEETSTVEQWYQEYAEIMCYATKTPKPATEGD